MKLLFKKKITQLIVGILIVSSCIPTAVLADEIVPHVASKIYDDQIDTEEFSPLIEVNLDEQKDSRDEQGNNETKELRKNSIEDLETFDSNFKWNNNGDGTATITEYLGSDLEVVIPSQIDGLTINTIGMYAFAGRSLTKVTFPETITNIENYSFTANLLESVIIPDNVISIGEGAFSDNKLTKISLPRNEVISIGAYAFVNNQLTNVSFSSAVVDIGNFAFIDNTIKSVNFIKGSLNIGDHAFSGNKIESIEFPSGEVTIGEYAFINNPLTKVSFSDGVLQIGDFAFYSTQLKEIPFGNAEISIGRFAFSETQITNLTLPKGVSDIGDYAFSYNQLTNISIPDTVKTIGNGAFMSNNLSTLIIPESVTTIGDYAFTDNQIVTAKILKDSVTFSDAGVFWGNGESEELTIYGYNPSTAKEYAATFNHKFVEIEREPTIPIPEPSVNGEVLVIHKDFKGNILETEKFTDLPLGKYQFKSKEFSGYKVKGEDNYEVTLTKENIKISIEFLYELVKKPTPIPDPPNVGPGVPGGKNNCFEYGDGTLQNPFLIMNATHLKKIQGCGLTDKHFKLNNDIDVNFEEWEAIKTFSGSINGDGHVISNLYLSHKDKQTAFIETLLEGAALKDITFINVKADSTKPYITFINESSFKSILSNVFIKGTYNGYNEVLNQFSTVPNDTNSIRISLYKELLIPNTVLPNPHGLPVAIMKANKDISLYELDKNGHFFKTEIAPKESSYLIYGTEKGFYKLVNGYYVHPSDEITVHIGKGEVRKKEVNVYDQNGKFLRTIQRGQQYKVYSFNKKRYAIGNGEFIELQDGVTYVFGWITVKEPITLYKPNGSIDRILKRGERYRVYRADKDCLHLGDGYKVKIEPTKFVFEKN